MINHSKFVRSTDTLVSGRRPPAKGEKVGDNAHGSTPHEVFVPSGAPGELTLLDKLQGASPPVATRSAEETKHIHQRIVDTAVRHASQQGLDVAFHLSPFGIQNGFTQEQREALTQAGVTIKVEDSHNQKVKSTETVDAMLASGMNVQFLSPETPFGKFHAKALLFEQG